MRRTDHAIPTPVNAPSVPNVKKILNMVLAPY
jgi:hypothetical protein